MIDVTKLQTIAEDLVGSAKDAISAKEAAELVKLIEEIVNEQSSSLKLQADREEILRKQVIWKDLITAVTPLLTTAILVGTLIFQAYSFEQAEKDKIFEAQRQSDLAEKTRWADALKVLSTTDKISPASALLRSFTLPPYKEEARHLVVSLLLQRVNDPPAFAELFKSNLVPLDWDIAEEVSRINKELSDQRTSLLLKKFDPKGTGKLSASEALQEKNLIQNLDVTVLSLAPLLKSSRPPDRKLDLQDTYFVDADLSHADLHGASIGSADFGSAQFEGADLSGITSFGYCVFASSAWWRAAKISPPLLAYLTQQYPFDPKNNDYSALGQVSEDDYKTSLARLHKLNGD